MLRMMNLRFDTRPSPIAKGAIVRNPYRKRKPIIIRVSYLSRYLPNASAFAFQSGLRDRILFPL